MKGVLFTELIEMMEDLMGLDFANKVIERACLDNEGAYTAVGTYPYQDLFRLLDSLGCLVENPQDKLMKSYGEYLFYRSCILYPEEVKKYPNTFSLLKEIPIILDREIRKLEPTAVVPDIEISMLSRDCMMLLYTSGKRTSFLLEGVIEGCIGHYQEFITLTRDECDTDRMKVRFVLLKNPGNERN